MRADFEFMLNVYRWLSWPDPISSISLFRPPSTCKVCHRIGRLSYIKSYGFHCSTSIYPSENQRSTAPVIWIHKRFLFRRNADDRPYQLHLWYRFVLAIIIRRFLAPESWIWIRYCLLIPISRAKGGLDPFFDPFFPFLDPQENIKIDKSDMASPEFPVVRFLFQFVPVFSEPFYHF